mgnify:CR=1 FL=1
MIIKEIELRDFRNYESLNLQFHNRVNIFLGDNAQGKTNIVEALYLTALGKSFRTSQDAEMIRFGSEFLKVKVQAEKNDEELAVELVITDKGKGAKVDGVKIKKISELLDNIYTVIFSPEDLKIVKEDPPAFQRFLFSFTQSASQTHQTVFILLISNYARSSSSSIFSKIGKQSKVAK